MKIKHLLWLGWAVALVGCTDLSEENIIELAPQGIKIELDGGIEQQYITRVDDGGFCHGDKIGLYGVNYTNNNTEVGVLQDGGNQVDNVCYTYDEENGKWTSSIPAYYKDVNTCIDLYAYYPYAAPSSVSEYEFEVATDQNNNDGYAASDFLWAKAEKVEPSENKVSMRFAHKLSCANVILVAGKGFAEGEFENLEKSVLVLNTTHTSTIDLSTGVATPIGSPSKEGILMMEGADGFRAVVVPQTIAANQKLFAITIDGITYHFSKSEEFTYATGMQSKFTLTVDKKAMTGEYEFTLTDTDIVEWIADLESHGGEARQYYVVNQKVPGTLGSLIRADKKNPNKIKNLKIAGKINVADFYFMRDSMELLQAINLKESTIESATKIEYKIDNDSKYRKEYLDGIITDDAEIKRLLQERYPNAWLIYITTTRTRYYGNEIPNEAFKDKKTLVYLSFPEKVTKIHDESFYQTMLSGALVVPDEVEEIGKHAFYNTNISSLTLPHKLKSIGEYAFSGCNVLTGTLSLPESLESLGGYAFSSCSMLSGSLTIPTKIKEIPTLCFMNCGFTSVKFPEGLVKIATSAFSSCDQLSGELILPNSLQELGLNTFSGCNFQSELYIPSLIQEIPSNCFSENSFTSIIFADDSQLLTIGTNAFSSNQSLCEPITFPQTMIAIEGDAFARCKLIPQIILPASTEVIATKAFDGCFGLSAITCKAVLPPTLGTGAFNGVPKDNFTIEVPEASVSRYQTANGWNEFRRGISAHHDFSISRPLLRALNAEYSKTYTLRAPANLAWSISEKPEWVTVTPAEGVGKTDITITIDEMEATTNTFESSYINQNGTIVSENYKGRSGEIVFLLNDKDYTSMMKVEQYQCDHYDGEVIVNQQAQKGKGVNLVFMGDCFDARDIATGRYLDGINEAIGYYFDIEPYKSYKEYFNIYTIIGMSPDTGMGTVNTVKEAKFGSQYSLDGIKPNTTITYEYAMKAETVEEDNLNETLVVMVENTPDYGGICYMWEDGSAIAICPMSRDAYPFDFRGIVQHEAGGHGFAKLADEYIYTNGFIENCTCPNEHLDSFYAGKRLGWYRNLSTNGDMNSVEWSHLIYHPDYANIVDIYEGGYFHTRGIYRSEATSCMNNNIDYYSAIQRQEMVERIMKYAGEEFDLNSFYAKDIRDASNNSVTRTSAKPSAAEQASARKQMAPQIMGNKPKLK